MAKARAGEFKTWRRRSGQRTPFDSMAASFTVENGVAKTSDLVMTGPDIAVSGAGETNLARQRLDYRMKAIVTAMTEEEKAGGTAEAGTVAIPFLVRGDWSDPEIAPDLQGLAKDPDALLGTAKAFGKSVEKFTDGKIKSEDFGRALDALFGGKKKKDRE
jgi:AsmA protein